MKSSICHLLNLNIYSVWFVHFLGLIKLICRFSSTCFKKYGAVWRLLFLYPRDDSLGALSFTHVRPVRPYENFRQAFLRNRKWDWFETWQDSLAWCIVRCKRLLWLSDINFLFDGTLFTLNTAKYTEFFVKFFSETVSGNDLKLDRMV